jgi:hypothetical protein
MLAVWASDAKDKPDFVRGCHLNLAPHGSICLSFLDARITDLTTSLASKYSHAAVAAAWFDLRCITAKVSCCECFLEGGMDEKVVNVCVEGQIHVCALYSIAIRTQRRY